MAVARARLVSKQPMRDSAASIGASPARIAQASVVLDYAEELSSAVLAGATSLDDADAEARRRKESANSAESRRLTFETASQLTSRISQQTGSRWNGIAPPGAVTVNPAGRSARQSRANEQYI